MITTHILDLSRGAPAANVRVQLDGQDGDGAWSEVGSAVTDSDGRAKDLLAPDFDLKPGVYRLTFYTAAYFESHGAKTFYPHVAVVFLVDDAKQHYHVPLLLSPFGYSTYRGS